MSTKVRSRSLVAAGATTALMLVVGLLSIEAGSASATADPSPSATTSTAPAGDGSPTDAGSPTTTTVPTTTPVAPSVSGRPPTTSAASAFGAPAQSTLVNVLAHSACNGAVSAPCPYANLVGSRLAVNGAPAVDGITAKVLASGIVSIAVASKILPGTVATFNYTIHDKYSTSSNTITLTVGAAPVVRNIGTSIGIGKQAAVDPLASATCDNGASPCPASAAKIVIGTDSTNPMVTATSSSTGQVTIKVDAKEPLFNVAHIPYTIIDKYGRASGLFVVTVVDTWKPPAGVVFNNPLGSYAQSLTIEQTALDLINHTPRGAIIMMRTYVVEGGDLSDALIRAHARGVQVRILQGTQIPSPQKGLYIGALGNNRFANSFYWECRFACRTAAGGTAHIKMMGITRSGAASNIVMSMSSSFSAVGSRVQWYDAFVSVDNSAAFQTFAHIFAESRQYTRAHDWYGVSVNASPSLQLFFPRVIRSLSEMGGTMPTPIIAPARTNGDWIQSVLSQVGCRANSGYGRNGRTVVRLTVRAIQGDRGFWIAHQLGELRAAGCDVQVIEVGASSYVLTELAKYGVPVADQSWRYRRDPCDDGSGKLCPVPILYTHMHALLVSGNYGIPCTAACAANTQQNYVWTGSESYNDEAYYADEQALRLSGVSIFNKYLTVFNANKAAYVHAPGLIPYGDPAWSPPLFP